MNENEVNKIGKNKIYEEAGAENFTQAIKLNGFSINKNNSVSSKTYFLGGQDVIHDKIDYDFSEKGGVITFSTDENAERLSNDILINWLKKKFETLKNKYDNGKKIENTPTQHNGVKCAAIGNFVMGRYKAKDGSFYDENSLSIELIGIDTNILNQVAEDIAREFKQETVLVKNYETDKIYLVK